MENQKVNQEGIEELSTRNANLSRAGKVETEFATTVDGGNHQVEGVIYIEVEGPNYPGGIGANVYFDTTRSNYSSARLYDIGHFFTRMWVKLTKNNTVLVEENIHTDPDGIHAWESPMFTTTASDTIHFEFRVLDLDNGPIYQGEILVANGRGSGYINKIS